MKLTDELVNQFVKAVNTTTPDKNDNTVYGTVVDNGDKLYVQLDGADEGVLTPIVTTATIKAGDRVIVSIRNHSAVVTGNAKDPSASSSEVAHALVRINSINDEVNGIGILLNGNDEVEGIVAKVNQNGIEIDSLGTRMNGLVTFEGLADGTTTVDGGCIKTGTIDAERINMTGAITWDDLASDAKTKVNNAQAIASSAADTADEALVTVSGFVIEDSTGTYIDGEMIYSESIYADALHLGGLLTVYKTMSSSNEGGYLGYDAGFCGSAGIGIRDTTESHQVVCTTAGARVSYAEDPSGDTPDQQVVCSSGGIFLDGTVVADMSASTSDRDRKNSIEDLPEKYVTMFDSLVPRRFKMNKGTSDRYHVGYIAQEVEEAMTAAGIDRKEFAGLVYGPDVNGEPIYMLRYGEFDAIYAAKIKQLEARIDELEKRLSKLEGVS